MIEKWCINCKFQGKRHDEEPCDRCISTNQSQWEPKEAKQIKIERRPELLPSPVPIYEHTDSEIPEKVRISFTNGTSAVYERHIEQPAPQVVESIKIIRRWKQGYVNQPMRRRRYRK